MSPITVCGSPGRLAQTVLALLIVYPVALIMTRSARRRHSLATVVVPVMVTPLFIGAVGTFVALANVMQKVATSGGGRLSQAAGVAQASLAIMFGAIAASVSGGIAIVDELLARRRGSRNPEARGVHQLLQIVVVSLGVGMLAWAGVLCVIAANDPGAPNAYRVPLISAGVALCAAIGTCGWLILLRRRDLALHPRHAIVASSAGVVLCSALGFGAWQVVQHYLEIANAGTPL